MILRDGKEYQDDEAVDWDVALNMDYSYFNLARNLGLPTPPACFVFLDYYSRTDKQSMICGWYDALLHAAKLDVILIKKEFLEKMSF